MITVRVSDKQNKGSGCSGKYYRVNANLGVKVGPDTENLFHEFKTLTKLHKAMPGRWPQPYCLAWVEIVGRGGRQKGLLMEHIEGKTLGSYSGTKKHKKFNRRASAAFGRCRRRGIEWNDYHQWNILVSKGRIRFVDAESVETYSLEIKRRRG